MSELLASGPGCSQVSPVDERDAETHRQSLQVGDVFNQLLVPFPAKSKDRHILERLVRLSFKWPGDVGVNLAGLGILMVDEHKPDRRLDCAEANPRHHL